MADGRYEARTRTRAASVSVTLAACCFLIGPIHWQISALHYILRKDPAMTDMTTRLDVFLSLNSADKPAVETLAQRLLAAGLKPWLDSWNLIPGDPWQEGLEEALDTCAVFLGPSGIGPWHNEEMRVALDRTRRFRVIPALLPGAAPANPDALPRFLSRMTWVDFQSGLDDSEAFRRLMVGICGVEVEADALPDGVGAAGQVFPAGEGARGDTQPVSEFLAR